MVIPLIYLRERSMASIKIKYPKTKVKFVRPNENAFHIMGMVRKELFKTEGPIVASEFVRQAFSCKSYDDLLKMCAEWVTISGKLKP